MQKLGWKEMEAEIIAPAHARFTIMKAVPLTGTPQPATVNKNEGIQKRAISPMGVTNIKITVAIRETEKSLNDTSQFLRPLKEWK